MWPLASTSHIREKRKMERTTNRIDADVAANAAIVNGRAASAALGVVPLHFSCLRNCHGKSNDERDDSGFDEHFDCWGRVPSVTRKKCRRVDALF
jgi:hypothetical protein